MYLVSLTTNQLSGIQKNNPLLLNIILICPSILLVLFVNRGVGYSIVQRLVDESPFPLTIILACRNKARAQEALTSLQLHFTSSSNSNSKTRTTPFHAPELKIELVDVGSATSVLAFNARILAQHSRVDFLFCNAGILPSVGLMWGKILTDMFKAPMDLVTRSDVLVQPKQYLTEDGVGNVLACNVFGHYLMVRFFFWKVDELRGGGSGMCCVLKSIFNHDHGY